jgi:hypothetical protein
MRALSAALLALALTACTAGGSDPPGSSTCLTNADCSSGTVCQFAVAASGNACGASGECGYAPLDRCAAQPVCTCTGATSAVCVVGGYVLGTPVRALGPCAGDDAGAPDAAPDTSTDAGADANGD